MNIQTDSIATGYAELADGTRLTYQQADDHLRAVLAAATPRQGVNVYIDASGQHLTSWTGGHLGTVTRWGKRHGHSVDRRYFTARAGGHTWHGIGSPGMYAPITRSVKP